MAWHQREFSVPAEWAGRRVCLSVDCLNSLALVFVDGKKVAEIRYPSGEADLTAACKPGGKHVLSLLVVALPLKGVMLSYSDTNSARSVKGTVERRGLCGDIYLTSSPAAARIADVRVDPSVRNGELTVNAAFEGLKDQRQYALRVAVTEQGRTVREFTSKPFKADDQRVGCISATDKWMPAKLWDIHTPQNQLTAQVSLLDDSGKAI